jgi:hypothetical protein
MKAFFPLCRRDYKPTSCIWNEYGLPLPLRQLACLQSTVIAIMWRLAASLAMASIFMRASIMPRRFQDTEWSPRRRSSGRASNQIGTAINMKADKELGIAFPTAVLVRADRVIE